MPRTEVTVACPIHDSFRVRQVAGMFDVPLAAEASATFAADLPDLDEPWQIGLIVGPSASGKTTLARAAFGDRLYESVPWPADRAVVDCLGELPIREITRLFTAVGFSSPPAWIKPASALSCGERFRCDLARALGSGVRGEGLGARDSSLAPRPQPPVPPIVAFDEFTSVVDRTVARIGSAAVARAIRGGQIGCRFVAVTCHYDVAEWLEPDWTVDMATGTCDRRRLRRPPIELAIFRCAREAWRRFAHHHYLTGALSGPARCFLAAWNDVPVAFCATLPILGRRKHWRVTRLVTLPDYQGVGIGTAVLEAVAELHRADGLRINITASHPAVIAHCRRSPHWRTVSVRTAGQVRRNRLVDNYAPAAGRAAASFEWLGAETLARSASEG